MTYLLVAVGSFIAGIAVTLALLYWSREDRSNFVTFKLVDKDGR